MRLYALLFRKAEALPYRSSGIKPVPTAPLFTEDNGENPPQADSGPITYYLNGWGDPAPTVFISYQSFVIRHYVFPQISFAILSELYYIIILVKKITYPRSNR